MIYITCYRQIGFNYMAPSLITSATTLPLDLCRPMGLHHTNHKTVVLPNGILTLLVSDNSRQIASAALCVAAGSHADPDNLPGLAHFCEHMLFMGTKQFPDVSHYKETISSFGGSTSAATTGEQTCFSFQIPTTSQTNGKNDSKDTIYVKTDEPVFNYTLRVFSSFFKEPLFNELEVQKEVYAIDNEHSVNKARNNRLLYHCLRILASEDNQFHRFATGNDATLGNLPRMEKIKLRDEVVKFYNREYLADKMTLVLVGPQSLNYLQKLAIANFGDLKGSKGSGGCSKVSISDFSVLSDSWASRYPSPLLGLDKKSLVVKNPNNNTSTLRLIFSLPEGDGRMALASAWANIYGNEGENSLFACLLGAGLITSLSAFPLLLTQNSVILVLDIDLTGAGGKSPSKVISYVQKSTKDIFNDPKVKRKMGKILSEMHSIDMINLLYGKEAMSPAAQAFEYAKALQSDFSKNSPQWILNGGPVLGDGSAYKGGVSECSAAKTWWASKGAEFIEMVQKAVNLDNMRIILMGNESVFNTFKGEKQQTKDPYFGFEYFCNSLELGNIVECDTLFSLIKPNCFLPVMAQNQTAMLKELLSDTDGSLRVDAKSMPERVAKADMYEVWNKYDQKLRDRSFVTLDLVNSEMQPSPQVCMIVELMCELASHKLKEKLYQAEQVGYQWGLYPGSDGDAKIRIQVTGFQGGIENIISTIKDEVFNITEISVAEFRKSRIGVRNRYDSLAEENPVVLGMVLLETLVEEHTWTIPQRLEALEEITFETFSKVRSKIFASSSYISILTQGGLSNDMALDFSKKVLGKFSLQNVSKSRSPSSHLVPTGSFDFHGKSSLGDPSNGIICFIQTGSRFDLMTKTLTWILSYYISINLVSELRDKQQLGYAVMSGVRVFRKTLGVHITIATADYSPDFVKAKVETYLGDLLKQLERLDENTFQEKIISGFEKSGIEEDANENIAGPPSMALNLTPTHESSGFKEVQDAHSHRFFFDEIVSRSFAFCDTEEQKLARVKDTTFPLFLSFFQTIVSPRSAEKSHLSVMLETRLSKQEIQSQLMYMQLEAFLRTKGLRVSSDVLESIMEKSKGSSSILMKELLKYFIAQGQSVKVCTVFLKEVIKQVSFKSKREESSGSENSKISSTRIRSVEEFQQMTERAV